MQKNVKLLISTTCIASILLNEHLHSDKLACRVKNGKNDAIMATMLKKQTDTSVVFLFTIRR